ncbi:hypothetical protein NDU88_006575 [Pleurodeles waltl]|uniref:Uncharacterized protein n=1 Tax=Pleurodeles waltl TaxID=8319 RepID=A0AAV7UQ42_PLEWA|nr:hypothetical protein NDU88_006575 [Pleurodeles waltl]
MAAAAPRRDSLAGESSARPPNDHGERPTGQVPPQEVRERRPRSAPQVLLGRTREERRFKRLSRSPSWLRPPIP